jgi:hypothetical protein
MSSRKNYHPTPEEITIAQAIKAERLRKKLEEATLDASVSRSIIQRPWLTVPSAKETSEDHLHVKVCTWNVSDIPLIFTALLMK